MAYTVETVYQVWDDETGERWEIGPDRDSLGLVEIRYYDEKGVCHDRMTFTKELAKLVQESLVKAIEQNT